MTKFIELTLTTNNQIVLYNVSQIVRVEKSEENTLIYLINGKSDAVKEKYQRVKTLIEQ